MVCYQKTFLRFLRRNQSLNGFYMHGHDMRKGLIQHREFRGRANDQVYFQQTPETARLLTEPDVLLAFKFREDLHEVGKGLTEVAEHFCNAIAARNEIKLREEGHQIAVPMQIEHTVLVDA